MLKLLCVIYVAWLSVCPVKGGQTGDEDWAHQETLDEKGKYRLYWTADNSSITFQVEVATTGWVGFGLSAHGDLSNSDIAIGWVNGSKANLYDYNGDDKGRVTLDKQMDWKLLEGSQNKSHTVLRFTRKLDTCDPGDWPITVDTQRILYAYSASDLATPEDVTFKSKMWRRASLKLLQPPVKMIPMPKDVIIVDMRAGNFTLPGNRHTYYHCRIFKTPPFKEKHHAIKITTVVQEDRLENVHHLVLSVCDFASQQEGDEVISLGGFECFRPENPPVLKKCDLYPAFAWGINGGSLVYPLHMGLPVGPGSEYYMLQLHYHNDNLENDLMDNSGIRMYLTPKLRPYDSGTILVGSIIQDMPVIPPGQREFIIAGHGSKECLRQALPEEGIHVSMAFLHTHLMGRKIILRHFRGNKELPYIASDMNYDFNHQIFTFLPKPVTVIPGDHLTVECYYDSTARNYTSFGGLRTDDEMCLIFLFYHSPIIVGAGLSAATLATTAGLTGLNLLSGRYNVTGYYGSEDFIFRQDLLHYDWPMDHMCTIQNAMRFSPHMSFCTTLNQVLQVPLATYPDPLKKKYAPPAPCKKNKMYYRAIGTPPMCLEN